MALEVSPQRLAEVLLDFGLAPGNFPVRLGEPRELYLQLNTVALWAIGRIPDGIEGDVAALTEAARLFVRRACFAPDNTHYQVMALQPRSFTADELRSRYRSLIRLTHPDRGVPGLPGNAAGIVNRAHEILSDPLLRSQYDDQLGERTAVAMPTGHGGRRMRRIDLSHGLGDWWYSVKARYPKLVRLVLPIAGVSAAAVGLVLWAASDGQEGRMLVINGSDLRARTQTEAASKAARLAVVVGPDRSPVDQPTSTAAPTRPADAPALPQATGATGSPVAPQPTPPMQPTQRSAADGQGSATIAETATKAAAAAPKDIVAGASASVQPARPWHPAAEAGDHARIAQPAPKLSSAPPQDDARTLPVTPGTAAPSPRGGSIATETVPAPAPPAPVSAAARAAAATTAAMAIAAAAPPRSAAATSPPVAAPPSAVTTPAPAPPSAPAVVALAQSPAPAAARHNGVETAAASPAVVQPGKTWDVDAVRAKHYLTELLSKLSDREAAKATNTYLANMNVTGSLFRPALTLMERYPEISVESLRWTDTEQPGILRMRGEIVLYARSPHEAPRSVNYGVSAEFWGTRTGTVLANLNLKERE